MSLNSPLIPGILWVVATPLGNPGDLSPRARQCLSEADAVLAEDTRRAGLAFARWGVKTGPIISLHDHNEQKKSETVLEHLRQGKNLALISDAGMPVLADPGYLIVRRCRAEGLLVSVIPGPCAPVTALAGSGIPPQPFVFFGFLPRKTADQEKTLVPYASLPATLVFFERKDRLAHTLDLARRLLGARETCIARELTKIHEEYVFFTLDTVPDLAGLKGEMTVIIGPPAQDVRTPREEVERVIREEMPGGGHGRAVARRVQARIQGWTGSQIYALIPRNSQGDS